MNPLKANFRNQWFLSDTNYICQFVEAKETHSSFVVVGMQYESKEEMFKLSAKDHISEIELSSTSLHIYKVKNNTPRQRVELPHQNIKCKLVAIHLPSQSLFSNSILTTIPSDTIGFFPLLHTFPKA